ncbi:MAG TPA: hypothetical protein PK843_14695 [bacterium]|nr:hypothetical protein [bacterium]HPN35762.1 hypothetical protein [bacterium]
MARVVHHPLCGVWQLVLLLLLIGASIGVSGEYAADFLTIGVGGRAMAMGSAFVAMADDPSMAYWNPAGMTLQQRIRLQLEHVPMFSNLAQYNSAHAVLALSPNMAFAIGWIRLGVDEIPRYGALQGSRYERLTQGRYRSTGEAEGYFGDQENAVTISFCRAVMFDLHIGDAFSPLILPVQLAFGVTGKYIHHQLDDATGAGQGLDAGVLARFVSNQVVQGEPIRWLGIGLSARNLSNTNVVWDTPSQHKDVADRALRVGAAASCHAPSLAARVTLTLDQELSESRETFAGAEVRFFERLGLRGGYAHDHMTAGAGLRLFSLSLDYAFVAGDLANTHRISAAFGW